MNKRRPSNMFSRFIIACCLLFSLLPPAHAQSLKQLLLMPGKLTASHQQYEAKCDSCHSEFDRSKQNTLCLDCHETITADLEQKQGFHGLNTAIAGQECRGCHTDHKGREFDIVGLDSDTFNHEITNFPLSGEHRTLSCSQCHSSNSSPISYRMEEYQCQGCHGEQSPHEDQLDGECSSCHNSTQWLQVEFDHSTTDFPLNASHGTTACKSCHINQQYQGIGKQCSSCHAIDDVHQQRFGQQCDDCHNEKEWQQPRFDHNQDTDFKLLFSHRNTSCKSCHTQPADVQKPAKECIGCHRADDIHNGSHGEKCTACHTVERWSKNEFDHNKETDFLLLGKHSNASCSSCHNQQQDNKTAGTECVDCHRPADPHRESLGGNCQQCHNSDAWNTSLFSHELVDFPLLGSHRQLSCEECHLDANYSDTSNNCISCHQNVDTHKGALGEKCEQCHTPNDWSMWLFDHNRQSHFPLKGAHQDLQCQLCHSSEKHLSQQCVSCHRDDDVHRGSFGQQCQHCHNENTFSR